jgi:hypothetical protein
MHKRTDPEGNEVWKYGFRWGQLDVVRHMEYRGVKNLGVETDHTSVEIYVSKGGRSIRVFRDGKELK